MPQGQKLSLTIDIDGSSRTITDLRKIREALAGAIDVPDKSPGLDALLSKVPRLAFAFNEVSNAAQGLLGQLQPAYDLLIGSNEQLNQQLLQSAASIAATSRVFQNGVQIKDPTQAIQALQPALQTEIKKVEASTQALVGVTSEQTSTVFNTILSNVGLLNEQLQGLGGKGKAFTNSLDAAASLAPGLVATLGTLQLPMAAAHQEIGALLTGEIDQNAAIAKSLGITRDMVQQWKAQGTLVSELNKRFEPFLKANALASRSVSGLTSNIKDIVQIAGRTAGAPLLTILVDQLDKVYQLLQANQGQITETTTQAVQIISNVLSTAIAAITEIINALTPSLHAVGAALADAFGAGATTAQTTIENLGSVIVGLVKTAEPFIQILAALTSGLANLSATPAGQTLIQFGLATAAVNLAIPKLLGGMSALFGAVQTVEKTFNTLLPVLAETNIAKSGLAVKEAALAIVTGTTTAAVEAETLARTQMTIGDTVGAAAALEVAAAEKAKAIAAQESAAALAGNIAKLGLMAAAVGSVALAVNEFQEITKEAKATEAGISSIDDSLAKLDEARAAANATTVEGARASQEAVRANVALIQASLNPVAKSIDVVIGFINQATARLNVLLKSPAAYLIPGLGAIKIAMNAVGQEGFPELSTGAEAAVSQAEESFGNLKVSVNRVFQEIGAVVKGADGKYQFPNLTGKSKPELDAYTKSLTASIAALEASHPVQEADLKFKNENLAQLKAAKAAIEAQTNSIQVQSNVLTDQGTIYQVLDKNAQNALRTLATTGNQDQANAAAKDIVQLTQQQLELGRISTAEAQKRLSAIANNGKIDVATRQAAQEAIGKVEETANAKSLERFQKKNQEIELLQAQGVITDAEAEARKTANHKAELDQQLAGVRKSIKAEQDAIAQGRGSKTRLASLKSKEGDLITQVAQAGATADKAAYDNRLKDIQQAEEEATAKVTSAEQSRQIAIAQLQNAGVISQRQAEQQKTASTKQRLTTELADAQKHLADLTALPTPDDPDLAQEHEKRIRQARQQTAQLTLQLIDNERQAQEEVHKSAVAAIEEEAANRRAQSEQVLDANAAAVRSNTAQNASLEREKAAQDAIVNALGQQQKLLDAKTKLQEAVNNLAATETKIRLDRMSETIDLQKRLSEEEDAGVKAVIQTRLNQLGVTGTEASIARQLAEERKKEAKETLVRLAQKQTAERASLELQLLQEAAQARSAVIEAKRNELAAQRQKLDAQKALNDARDSKAAAEDQLQEAASIVDPEERKKAQREAQRNLRSADRDIASAQQGLDLANQGTDLATQGVKEAENGVVIQAKLAEYSRATLDAQQKAESAVAKQAADSETFAANLQAAEVSAASIAKSLGGSTNGSIPQRKMGGDVQAGQMYQVHQDELFVPNRSGYMLNRTDAMRVAVKPYRGGVYHWRVSKHWVVRVVRMLAFHLRSPHCKRRSNNAAMGLIFRHCNRA